MNLDNHWNPEEEMRDLLAGIHEFLEPQDRKFIDGELTNREWGVALDLILFLAERRKLPLTNTARGKMYALAARMRIDLDDRRRNWPH